MPSGDALLPEDSQDAQVPERAVNMIFLTVFIDILAATISTPVLPFYAEIFGATTVQIGYLFAAWSFCSTAFAPMLGSMSDKFGRRPILIAALFGAGLANVFQGLSAYLIPVVGQSLAFYVYGFFRGTSGMFAAIGTVTNVYIADVVPKPELPSYMAKMSIVGPLAFTFGPALGGGLATIGGFNTPVLVDGVITLFSAFLVAQHLPETAAFLRLKAKRESRGGQMEDGSPKAAEVKEKLPWQVMMLSAAAFFGGLTMSASVSMQALFLTKTYGLDVLHVTWVSVGSAVTLVLTGMFVSVRVKNLLGLTWTVVVMNTFGGCLYVFMAFCGYRRLDVWFFVVSAWLGSMQSSVAGASTGPLLNEFCDTSNRGRITSTSQMCMNLGRMLGPLTYGHLAQYNISAVWLVAGAALFMKAFLTAFVQPAKEERQPSIGRRLTMYGPDWADEVGSAEDVSRLGKYVADILTKGHYRWVSRKPEIESLLAKLLPELDVANKELYEKQVCEIEAGTELARARCGDRC